MDLPPGNGRGIHLFEVNRATGAMTPAGIYETGTSPSCLALSASRTRLYSTNETDRMGDDKEGVLVANYFGGSVPVLPVLPDGRLGPATDVKKDVGEIGPTRAASAPPGSFAFSGHDRTHAHMIQADPSGRFVLHVDLGLDRSWLQPMAALSTLATGCTTASGSSP